MIRRAFSRKGFFKKMTRVFRVRDWWECKIACALGTIYGTALLLKVPIITLWPFLLAVMVGLFFAASYVSIINDLTDWPEDLASGKVAAGTERLLGLRLTALGFCLIGGLSVLFWFRHYPLTSLFYLANWIVFALYSIPPVRLKTRGAMGRADGCVWKPRAPHALGSDADFGRHRHEAATRFFDSLDALGIRPWIAGHSFSPNQGLRQRSTHRGANLCRADRSQVVESTHRLGSLSH